MTTALLDIDAAAARLGVNVRYMRHLVAHRTIPYHKVGRLVRFDPADLDAFVATGRREAVSAS
ncbi:DNA-binding protein [Blastococcus sp. CT_GayMR16]|nr:DNA-binding protein [Blastococcus sp. CT_GayMR16]